MNETKFNYKIYITVRWENTKNTNQKVLFINIGSDVIA